jgi:hypothetical protein
VSMYSSSASVPFSSASSALLKSVFHNDEWIQDKIPRIPLEVIKKDTKEFMLAFSGLFSPNSHFL